VTRERVHEVAPGVLRIIAPLPFPDPATINCYVISTPEGDVLVDPGMIGSEEAIDGGLAEMGRQPRQVLITHGHPDHFGLAGRYGDLVWAHPDALEQTEMATAAEPDPTMQGALSGRDVDTDSMAMMFALIAKLTVPLPPARHLEDGDRIGEWQALLTPGHAPGHLCLYRERDRVLLVGDILLPETTPNLHLTRTMRDAVSDFIASLERLAELEISLVLPSHGEPFTDAAGRAAQLIAHHERRLQRLIDELAEGPRSEGDLTSALFGHLEVSDHIVMAHMETHAHLEHLRLRDRIGFEEPDIWSLASSRVG